jgi:hypothetical protein
MLRICKNVADRWIVKEKVYRSHKDSQDKQE